MKLTAKLVDFGGKLKILRSSNKHRFSQKLSLAFKTGNDFKTYFLQVVYKGSDSNSGKYIDKKSFMGAYNAFTDPTLVESW